LVLPGCGRPAGLIVEEVAFAKALFVLAVVEEGLLKVFDEEGPFVGVFHEVPKVGTGSPKHASKAAVDDCWIC